MVTVNSSYILHQGSLEWCIGALRDCLEIGQTGSSPFKKTSPEIEFTLPLQDGGRSPPVCWRIEIASYSDMLEDRPTFKVYIKLRVKDDGIGRLVGIKSAMSISTYETNEVIEDRVSYNILKAETRSYSPYWTIKLSSILPSYSFVKILCSIKLYDWTDETKSPPSKSVEMCQTPLKCIHGDSMRQYSEELSHFLNEDRLLGANSDAILKYGEAEYKVHKCILAVQSDFFKARFSWDVKDGAVHTVDMNDTDLTEDIMEPLLCGVYTGKVESQEMALKLLPVTDKYQFKKLKAICESVICSQLSKESVLEMYDFAKNCNAQELIAKCEMLIKL